MVYMSEYFPGVCQKAFQRSHITDSFTVIKGHLNAIVFELIRKIMKPSILIESIKWGKGEGLGTAYQNKKNVPIN